MSIHTNIQQSYLDKAAEIQVMASQYIESIGKMPLRTEISIQQKLQEMDTNIYSLLELRSNFKASMENVTPKNNEQRRLLHEAMRSSALAVLDTITSYSTIIHTAYLHFKSKTNLKPWEERALQYFYNNPYEDDNAALVLELATEWATLL